VAEVGPGDNFGVAMLALLNGAACYTAVDRFYSRRDDEQQDKIYAALARHFDASSAFEGRPSERNLRDFSYLPGQPAEVFFSSSSEMFDFIISRAVLEHLYDPLGALDSMALRLTEGGTLIHRIDLRDHGMFSGLHPLTFLSIPSGVYRLMTKERGLPNRFLYSDYKSWLEKSGLRGRLGVTRLVGDPDELAGVPFDQIDPRRIARSVELVRAIRRKLHGRYAAMSDADLSVSGCVLVASRA